jgi:trehalose 6-phosphate phosphatase
MRAKAGKTMKKAQFLLSEPDGGGEAVDCEDKGYSLSLHYRRAPDPLCAATFAHAVAAGLPQARLADGKCLLNLVPAATTDKGSAPLQELQRSGSPCAFFVGDHHR